MKHSFINGRIIIIIIIINGWINVPFKDILTLICLIPSKFIIIIIIINLGDLIMICHAP